MSRAFADARENKQVAGIGLNRYTTSKFGRGNSIYYPPGYCKQMQQVCREESERLDALGRRKRERFNENVSYEASERKSRLKALSSALSQINLSGEKSLAQSRQSVGKESYTRRRIS